MIPTPHAAACESQPGFPNTVPVACNLTGFMALIRAVSKVAAVAASAVFCFLKFVDETSFSECFESCKSVEPWVRREWR